MTELKDYFKLRSDVYRILSYPYHKESTKDYIELLQKYIDMMETQANNIGESEEASLIKEGVELIRKSLRQPVTLETLIDEHERFFAGIFLSVLDNMGVTPHESVYLSNMHKAMQQERDDVLEAYCNEKIGPDKKLFNEPEDHVSAELMFLSILSKQTAEALNVLDYDRAENRISVQLNFINDHLSKWVSLMSKAIEKSASILKDSAVCGSDQYFIGIAKLTEGYVIMDKTLLTELISKT